MSAVTMYEDFDPGRVFVHRRGRTITDADALLFATTTHLSQPAYFDRLEARRGGNEVLPVSPYLLLAVVIGLSVEDLSESGGPFLGADDIRFGDPVPVGSTIEAASRVVMRRESGKRPGWGIVEWETVGAVGEQEVVRFRRTSLVRKKDAS